MIIPNGKALTVDERSMDSVQVFLREYNSTAGQKWRLKSCNLQIQNFLQRIQAFNCFFCSLRTNFFFQLAIGESFYLRPTSNERAVLDLDQNTLGIWGRVSDPQIKTPTSNNSSLFTLFPDVFLREPETLEFELDGGRIPSDSKSAYTWMVPYNKRVKDYPCFCRLMRSL